MPLGALLMVWIHQNFQLLLPFLFGLMIFFHKSCGKINRPFDFNIIDVLIIIDTKE